MGRILFLDVDGTLVDYSGRLPASAVAAVRAARRNGHRVYICTGRSEAEVYPALWDIGLDGMIGGNGSYVKAGDTVVLWQHLSAQQCRRAVDWLYARGLEFYLEANSGLYASERFEEKGTPVLRAYAGRKGQDAAALTVRRAFPDMIFGARGAELYRDDVNKISFILGSWQDHLDSAAAFPDLKAGTWGGAGETALFGDLGVAGIDKGHAIDVLLGYLGADIADTVAFGDAAADIPMLQKCAVGVAMGGGGAGAKAAADYVTAGVEEDGLYKAFEHLGLI